MQDQSIRWISSAPRLKDRKSKVKLHGPIIKALTLPSSSFGRRFEGEDRSGGAMVTICTGFVTTRHMADPTLQAAISG
jgi:hypothetical protein